MRIADGWYGAARTFRHNHAAARSGPIRTI